MRALVIAGVVGVLSGFGCMGTSSGRGPDEPLVAGVEQVSGQLGKRVRVVGEAKNAAHGPTVVERGFVVHMDAFRAWPAAIIGKRVEVIGVLAQDSRPAAIEGLRVSDVEPQVILREASYLLVE